MAQRDDNKRKQSVSDLELIEFKPPIDLIPDEFVRSSNENVLVELICAGNDSEAHLLGDVLSNYGFSVSKTDRDKEKLDIIRPDEKWISNGSSHQTEPMPGPSDSIEPIPGPSHQIEPFPEPSHQIEPIPGPSHQIEPIPGPSNKPTSFQKILVSLLENRQRQNESLQPRRKRICTGTEILTTEDYFKRKEKEEEERILKESKKKKINTKESLKVKKGNHVLKEKSKIDTKFNKRKERSSSESSESSSHTSLEKELEENYVDEEFDLIDDEFLSLEDEERLDENSAPLELEEIEEAPGLREKNRSQEIQTESVMEDEIDYNHMQVETSDFVLCNFIYNKGTKKETQKEFVCKIISKTNEELRVSCLRKKENFYIFPNVPDIVILKHNEFQRKLPAPIEKRGRFFFGEV
ncbi:unnamed protein product [Ceutorhynchus assimilis]|uniref:Uncharacterized protein n=1 Tax=Ceutorhynchus assimilis TaxID=467358 RepID=A0A9N9MFQ6_9CUCU|nr:unnamed protein product [Ceutorhynchus assimilis]